MSNITVKQLAEEIGVTPQGVNKYLRTSGLQNQAIKDGNRFLIPAELANQIRNHFQKQTETELETKTKISPSVSDFENDSKSKNADDSSNSKAIDALVAQLDILQKQLEVKDEQIKTLTDALANANETNKALSAANAVQIAADKKELFLASSDRMTENDTVEEQEEDGEQLIVGYNQQTEESASEQLRKLTFGQRLSFLFTGRLD